MASITIGTLITTVVQSILLPWNRRETQRMLTLVITLGTSWYQYKEQ